MGTIYSLGDFLDMTWRRRWLIIMVILLGSILSLFIALKQTHLYHSYEVMQIEQPTVSGEMAPSTVDGSAARRFQLIEQQVMARSNLIDVIEKFNIYSDAPDLKMSEKVDLLRRSIEITSVAAVREGFGDDGAISILTIRAEMESAELAQAVAHEFADRTRALSAAQRKQQTAETLAFFERQERDILRQISELESEIEAFRTAHELTSAGGVDFKLAEVASLNESILELDSAIIAAELARAQIDRSDRASTIARTEQEIDGRLATLTSQRDLLVQRRQALLETVQTSPEIERELANLDRQMEKLQSQYDVISTRRTEAQVGFSLEEAAQGERLITLEEAQVPDYPITASRKNRAIMGGVASVLAAFALAWLMELRNPVIRTARQMERETGVIPVVSIPTMEIKTPTDHKSGRNARAAARTG